jgi:hypothetical protein
LDRVVARTIKGLFYQKKRARLPDEYEVTVWSESGLGHLPKEQLAEVRAKLVDPLLAVAPETIGQNVFSYRVAFDADDPNISGWLLVFYEHIRFVGMSLSRPVSLAPGVEASIYK